MKPNMRMIYINKENKPPVVVEQTMTDKEKKYWELVTKINKND